MRLKLPFLNFIGQAKSFRLQIDKFLASIFLRDLRFVVIRNRLCSLFQNDIDPIDFNEFSSKIFSYDTLIPITIIESYKC